MKFQFSKHVLEELEKRKIPQKLVEQTLYVPEQKVPEVDDIMCYQSRVEISGKTYLLRVMVNETLNPPSWLLCIAPARSQSIGGSHEGEI